MIKSFKLDVFKIRLLIIKLDKRTVISLPFIVKRNALE